MRHFLVSPLPRRRRCRLILLLTAAISTLIFLLSISTSNVEPSDALAFASHFARRRHWGGEEEEAAARFAEPSDALAFASHLPGRPDRGEQEEDAAAAAKEEVVVVEGHNGRASCATVEKMGEAFAASSEEESLRVRELIERHFDLNGAARVRELPPHQFCRQGFVIGKASEAGFGNEMYKILTAAALSVMLNRSLIIGQTRSLYPFGDYVSYTNCSFSLQEVKHLWRKHDCAGTYRRKLIVRVDSFEQPQYTNVLCSNWKQWKHPIIWFQGTTDAVAIQFFLKNVHPQMKSAASVLFGQEQSFKSRPNVFGELMRAILSPTPAIEEAIDWVLQGVNPDVVLHMRMMSNRSVRSMEAAVQCIKKAVNNLLHQGAKPRVLLISDTPSFAKEITSYLTEFSQVLHFNYKNFQWNSSTGSMKMQQQPDFRVKDWGPAPRWVALVDFFLASRAKHAVVSGAHRRVGTTYAQLIAALAAANQHGKHTSGSNFSFLSSFQSNLLVDGLRSQIGWGHIWHRFAGPLSCSHQSHQCALTPLLPPAWWDGEWQNPTARDTEKLKAFGVRLTDGGKVSESHLQAFCSSREDHVKTLKVFGQF